MPPAPPCSWPLLYHRLRTGPPCGLRDVPVRRRPPLPGAAQYRRKFACPCCSVDRPVAKEGSQRARESPHRMQTRTNELSGVSSLFSVSGRLVFRRQPQGDREEERLLRKTWLGEQIVVWCDRGRRRLRGRGGTARISARTSAPKPAVGCAAAASFARFTASSTTLQGNASRRPTPRRRSPPGSEVFETRQILGLVFAWHSTAGRAPQWDLPAPPPGEGDWSGMESPERPVRGPSRRKRPRTPSISDICAMCTAMTA